MLGIESSVVAGPAHSKSPLRHAALIVCFGGIVVAGLTVAFLHLAARRYTPTEVGAFMIFRLACVVFLAFGMLGMPVALLRSLPLLGSEPRRAATCSLVGILMAVAGMGVIGLPAAALSGPISAYLSHPEAGPLWRSSMALCLAHAFTSSVSQVQFVRGRIVQSTLLNLATYGLAPVLALAMRPTAPLSEVMLLAAALGAGATSLAFMGLVSWACTTGIASPTPEARLLLRYGLPRTPSSAVEPLVDSSVPWLAMIVGVPVEQAGFLAVGLSLLRLINPITTALNQVLIPASALALTRGDSELGRSRIRAITEFSLHAGLFASLQLVVWSDFLIRWWLGTGYSAGVGTIRILALSLVPSFLYGALRGVIDGESEQPVNTFNLGVSLAAFLLFVGLIALVGWGVRAQAFAYLGSRVLLGALTLRYLCRRHRLELGHLHFGAATIFSTSSALACIGARAALPPHYAPLVLFVGVSLAAAVFVAGMGALGSAWARGCALRFSLCRGPRR